MFVTFFTFDLNHFFFNQLQVFCLHGGLSPSLDTLDNIRSLDRIQEVLPSLFGLEEFFSEKSKEDLIGHVFDSYVWCDDL